MTMLTTTFSARAPLFAAPVARLKSALRRRAAYNRVAAELFSLSDRDLADIGLARTMIPQIAAESAAAA